MSFPKKLLSSVFSLLLLGDKEEWRCSSESATLASLPDDVVRLLNEHLIETVVDSEPRVGLMLDRATRNRVLGAMECFDGYEEGCSEAAFEEWKTRPEGEARGQRVVEHTTDASRTRGRGEDGVPRLWGGQWAWWLHRRRLGAMRPCTPTNLQWTT